MCSIKRSRMDYGKLLNYKDVREHFCGGEEVFLSASRKVRA